MKDKKSTEYKARRHQSRAAGAIALNVCFSDPPISSGFAFEMISPSSTISFAPWPCRDQQEDQL